MIHLKFRAGAMLAVSVLAIAACGSDDGGDKTPAATSAPTESSSGTPAATAKATQPPRAPGAPVDQEAAAAILNVVLIGPADIDEPGWVIQSDTTTDNAAAAAADPTQAASIERCGRLLARTVTNFPDDPLAAFIGGETLAYFSTATVYRDAAGATDCAAEAATRLSEPGALAKQFGGVFVDPNAVIVSPVGYETVADGSFAMTLTGQTSAAGTVIDLTLLIVGFRSGNVTAVVGSARSGSAPPTSELKPYVNLVVERIQGSQ